jgi:cytochrome b
MIRVWDLPTRLFHWVLVACICGLVATGFIGGNAMNWHFRFGYVVFSLLLFRLAWGFIGGHWSLWKHFPVQPSQLWKYCFCKSDSESDFGLGHNPFGALSVLALMLLLCIQVFSGLFSDDEIAFAGPLSHWASSSLVAWLTAWHKGWGKALLLFWVGLHVLALLWHSLIKHQRLLPAIWHGYKIFTAVAPASVDSSARRWLAGLVFCTCVFLVYGLIFISEIP